MTNCLQPATPQNQTCSLEGPKRGLERGLERGLLQGFWALTSIFAKYFFIQALLLCRKKTNENPTMPQRTRNGGWGAQSPRIHRM